MNTKIVKVTIGPYPTGMFDPMPKVHATFEDGSEKDLFEFYPDELSFSEAEFVGLTAEEGEQLKFKKDKAYLQS